MVDDNLVATVRAQRRQDSLSNSLAGFDVANDGTIFGIVAIENEVSAAVL